MVNNNYIFMEDGRLIDANLIHFEQTEVLNTLENNTMKSSPAKIISTVGSESVIDTGLRAVSSPSDK